MKLRAIVERIRSGLENIREMQSSNSMIGAVG